MKPTYKQIGITFIKLAFCFALSISIPVIIALCILNVFN